MLKRGTVINKRHSGLTKKTYTEKSGVTPHVKNITETPQSDNMKVAVCVIAKWEEQYLPEWVEHYKSIGFDNVLFYDNNEPDDNGQYVVLKPYIDSGFVIYHDWRDRHLCQQQKKAYHATFEKYKDNYNWIAFFDADEFLELVNHETIKEFIESNEKFNKFQGIRVAWQNYDDNDMVFNDGRPLKERFTRQMPTITKWNVKTIINCKNVTDIGEGKSVHTLGLKNCCDGSGVRVRYASYVPTLKKTGAYLKHYYFKTTEEVVKKIKRGSAAFSEESRKNIMHYFLIGNNLTYAKLQVLKKEFSPKKVDNTLKRIFKTSVCVVSKKNEIRIPEWVEHYKSIGFDNVLFYDNNEPDDNGQYVVLKPYIDSGFVIYHDWRGKCDFQKQRGYNDCCSKYREGYRWIGFFNIGDFLTLEKSGNIKDFLLKNGEFGGSNGIIIHRKYYFRGGGADGALLPDGSIRDGFSFLIRTRFNECSFIGDYSVIYDNGFPYINEHAGVFLDTKKRIVPHRTNFERTFKGAYIVHKEMNNFVDVLHALKNGFTDTSMFEQHSLNKIIDGLKLYFSVRDITDEHLSLISTFFPLHHITKEDIKQTDNEVLDCDIDYVFPYVDDSDEGWYKEYIKHKGVEKYETDVVSGAVRYKTYDLLKYKLRSIEQNMPWVRNIYMIVASPSQVPEWLDTTKVKIVYHKDIIPEYLLPTFNSTTIEMFLGNIEGLGERFIYGNDDFYVTTKILPTMFFRGRRPLLSIHERNVGYVEKEGDDMAKLTTNIISNCISITKRNTKYKDFDKIYQPVHHMKPMIKSINQKILNDNYEEIVSRCTKFRENNNLTQYLFHYYLIFNEMHIEYHLTPTNMIKYGLNDKRDSKLIRLIEKGTHLLSIDFHEGVTEEKIDILKETFNKYWGNKSKFEKA